MIEIEKVEVEDYGTRDEPRMFWVTYFRADGRKYQMRLPAKDELDAAMQVTKKEQTS